MKTKYFIFYFLLITLLMLSSLFDIREPFEDKCYDKNNNEIKGLICINENELTTTGQIKIVLSLCGLMTLVTLEFRSLLMFNRYY